MLQHATVFKDFLHLYRKCVRFSFFFFTFFICSLFCSLITVKCVYLSQQTTLSCDTDAALSNMKQIGDVVREDHQNLVSHVCNTYFTSLPSDINSVQLVDLFFFFLCVVQYGQIKSLFEKTKATQTVMMQKVKDALHQRDDMRMQMEEAFTAKEAVSTVTNLLIVNMTFEV